MSTSIINPLDYMKWVEGINEMRLKTPDEFTDDKKCWEAATKLCFKDGAFANLHFRTAFKWEQQPEDKEPKRVDIRSGTTLPETAFRLRYGWTKQGATAVLQHENEFFASFGDPFQVYGLDPAMADTGQWDTLVGTSDLIMVRWSKINKRAECQLVAHLMRPVDAWHDTCFNSDLLQSRPKKGGKELAIRIRPPELHDEQFVFKWCKKQAEEYLRMVAVATQHGGGGGVAAAGPAAERAAAAKDSV